MYKNEQKWERNKSMETTSYTTSFLICHEFFLLFLLFFFFFPFKMEKDVKTPKIWFYPVNIIQNTCLLVEMHTKLPLMEICCMSGMMFVQFLGEIALQLSDPAISLPSIPFYQWFPTFFSVEEHIFNTFWPRRS